MTLLSENVVGLTTFFLEVTEVAGLHRIIHYVRVILGYHILLLLLIVLHIGLEADSAIIPWRSSLRRHLIIASLSI